MELAVETEQLTTHDPRPAPAAPPAAGAASADTPADPPTPGRIMEMAAGYKVSLILEAAVRLALFDALASGPATLGEVAARTGASQRGLRAVLNALVGLGLLGRRGERYALAPESAAYLVSTSPTYQGHMFKHTSRHLLPRWLCLTEAVQTGRPPNPVNEADEGGPFFREFVEDLFPMSYDAARALAGELGVAAADGTVHVLDLAAGSGVWGVALAEASPRVRVTAVDWPDVLPVTRRVADRHGVHDRFRFVAGDLLSADFGSGYHVATLGHILHSEGESRARRLLARTFDALAPGGTVVIAEHVADEDRGGPVNALIFAVAMLVNTEAGDTFTFGEMSVWLRDAGFVAVRQCDAPHPSPLILATKP